MLIVLLTLLLWLVDYYGSTVHGIYWMEAGACAVFDERCLESVIKVTHGIINLHHVVVAPSAMWFCASSLVSVH